MRPGRGFICSEATKLLGAVAELATGHVLIHHNICIGGRAYFSVGRELLAIVGAVPLQVTEANGGIAGRFVLALRPSLRATSEFQSLMNVGAAKMFGPWKEVGRQHQPAKGSSLSGP